MTPPEWVILGQHVEVDKVARELATTGRYADPYLLPTGPTAHPLPVHTGLQALIVLVFGVTPAAAYARCLCGIVACAAMYAMLPWLSRRLGLGERAGIVGGSVGALVPLYGTSDVLGFLWNEAMAGIALGLLATMFRRRLASPQGFSAGGAAAFGVLAGASFHLSPQLLPVVAAYLMFALGWRRDRRAWRGAAIVVGGSLLVCLPWGLRNASALHDFVFVRSNFGLELSLANRDGTRAEIWGTSPRPAHPGHDAAEAARVRDLGEAVYMRRMRDEALRWIRAHPGQFARLTASRVWHVWFGPPDRPLAALPVAALTVLAALGFRRLLPGLDRPQRVALLVPIAAFPLVTYVLAYIPRYVFPLTGILLVLAASEVLAWRRAPAGQLDAGAATPSADDEERASRQAGRGARV